MAWCVRACVRACLSVRHRVKAALRYVQSNNFIEFLVDLPTDLGPNDWIVVTTSAQVFTKEPKFGDEVSRACDGWGKC